MNPDAPQSQFNVAASPHWRDGSSLPGIQQTWLLALLPAIVASGVYFGFAGLRVVALAVVASVIAEVVWNSLVPNRDFASNYSSVTMGVLLAFLLPVGAPWWLVVVGSFLTVIIGKKLYGGWGAYPVHPVALGYAFLAVSWPSRLDYTESLVAQAWSVTMIEPMRLAKTLGTSAEASFNLTDLFLGLQVGGVGNALVLWLLLGGLFLVLVREIPWQIPVGGILGVVACAALLGVVAADRSVSPVFHLLAGSTVLMIFFMAPEHTTSPVNPRPMFFYGLLMGVLMVLIRTFSIHVDGAIFAVLLANFFSPLLDRITPRILGQEVQDIA
ncbi:MAG: RnfABCDGE type electron transport complex subunit D [Gemmatimonadales bacterium]|nr:RnfABCDGE type electron transport complex subunit D [Gemmatimonadales bacterium]